MPRSTFCNLPEKRKEEIIHACFEEFAQHDYRNASVSRIVKKLGIAKGSFYRYFDNKLEIYYFLLDHAVALQMEHIKELFELPSGDFFSLFEKNLAMRIKFDLTFPLQSAFLDNTLQERNNEALSNRPARSKEMMIELLIPVIEKYMKAGEIRTDISSVSIVYLIIQTQLGITDFLKMRHTINDKQNSIHRQQVFSISEQNILNTVKEFSSILALGMAKR